MSLSRRIVSVYASHTKQVVASSRELRECRRRRALFFSGEQMMNDPT
jgi:hypothetical protein